MLEVLPSEGLVVAFRAQGQLTADDYDRMTARLDQQLSAHEQVGLLADVSALDGLTLAALARDFQYSLSKLGELHRFARVAVLGDRPLLRAWTQLAWLLVPRSQVRSFDAAEREAALSWLGELRDEPPKRALSWLQTTRPDTHAFVCNGTITDADMDEVLEKLARELDTHMTLRLLVRIENLKGIRPHALLRGQLLRVKALGLRKVERYAIVSQHAWLARYVELARRLSGMDVRFYPLEQEQAAWTWLEAAPARAAAGDGAPAVH